MTEEHRGPQVIDGALVRVVVVGGIVRELPDAKLDATQLMTIWPRSGSRVVRTSDIPLASTSAR